MLILDPPKESMSYKKPARSHVSAFFVHPTAHTETAQMVEFPLCGFITVFMLLIHPTWYDPF